MIWIDASNSTGMNGIDLDWFLTDFHRTRIKTSSGLVRYDFNILETGFWNKSE